MYASYSTVLIITVYIPHKQTTDPYETTSTDEILIQTPPANAFVRNHTHHDIVHHRCLRGESCRVVPIDDGASVQTRLAWSLLACDPLAWTHPPAPRVSCPASPCACLPCCSTCGDVRNSHRHESSSQQSLVLVFDRSFWKFDHACVIFPSCDAALQYVQVGLGFLT